MFPHEKQTVATLNDAISMVQSPDNRFYAILHPSSILILDAFDRSFVEVTKFETKPGNANHWILWPASNKIICGTFSGNINILTFERFHLKLDLEKSLGCVITSAFLTKNGHFGFSLIGPRLIEMNTNGEILSNLNLDTKFGIVKSVVYINEKKICLKSYNTWYIYNKETRATENINQLESVTKASDQGLILLASNGTVSSYDTETKESDVLIGGGVSYVHTFSRGLIGITREGSVCVYDSLLKETYHKDLSLSNVICSFVDEFGKKLVVLNTEGEIICVKLFTITPPYLLTDTSLVAIDGLRLTAEIPDFMTARHVKALPLDLFPLQNIVPNGDSSVCVIGRTGVAIMHKFSLFYDPDVRAKFAVWINDMLCLIAEDGLMTIYNDELLKIGDFKLSEIPSFVSASGMCIVMSTGSKYCVFNFGERRENETVITAGHLEIGVTSFEMSFNLRKVFILQDKSVYAESEDGTVYSVETNQPVFYTVQASWASDNALFCLKDGVTVISDGKTARFPNIRSLYSWRTGIYKINTEISISSTDFAGKLVPLGSPEQNKLAKSMMTMIGQLGWEEQFSSLLSPETPFEELALALNQIDTSLVPQFMNLMPDNIIESLARVGFDFTPFFADVKQSIQSRILNRIQPDLFDKLTDTHNRLIASKEDRFKYFVANRILDRYAFIRAMKFARVANINFTALLEQKDITGVSMHECLKAIRSDIGAWNYATDAEIVDLLGKSFQFVELSNWALACFLILGSEDRVGALLNDQPMALLMAMQLTREQPADEESVFLKNLQLGF